jgi:hypothetical protein
VSYEVDVLDEVRNEDIPALPGQALKRAAAELFAQLYVDPRLGEPMRERFNLAILRDCRKVAFDEPDWKGKPRYRFVFRNEPDDSAVGRTTVLSIGPREDFAAYKRAATRRGRQQRQDR